MLLLTLENIEGQKIKDYHGIVVGEAVMGANILKDAFAKVRDVVGGHVKGYEKVLHKARESALEDLTQAAEKLGANAVLGIDFDYEFLGKDNTILLVTATGTAVTVAKKGERRKEKGKG